MDPIGVVHHDHDACIADCLAAVEATCKREKLQLTPVRRRVLEILLSEHKAMGAYDILEVLRADGLGSQPPVAYRALDFLITHGFAHKIERLNAFVACAYPSEDHAPAFLICRGCAAVAETQTKPASGTLGRTASDAGFEIEQTVLEAEGLCADCRSSAAAE